MRPGHVVMAVSLIPGYVTSENAEGTTWLVARVWNHASKEVVLLISRVTIGGKGGLGQNEVTIRSGI